MNILLIEDDAGLVELITTNLEELGFSVMSATTGAEALAYLSKQTPDLMLLDYSLPDINGNELIETLIKKQTPPPPFIITTGQGDERIAVDMMKLGAIDYLVKDILFIERLPDVVHRVIKEIESDAKLKQAEKALIQSEATIKNKLKAITDPEGDISTLELSDIIDTEVLQSMMEGFYQLTGMLGAVLDVSGKVLVAAGWQDICTKFHRCNAATLKNCIESDTILTQGVSEGTFKSYHCKNNMWDIVTPIMVGGRHVGNVFMGQYFLEDEKPDVEFFRKQAKKHGFDEAAYLAALDRVPRFSKETVDAGMRFYSKLAGIISTMSYSSIQQSRMLAQQKQIELDLIKAKENAEESEDRLRGFMASATDGFMLFDSELNQIDINDVALRITKQKREEIIGRNMLELVPDLKKSGRYDKFMEVISTGNPITFDDIVPHTKFGDIRISLKAFKVAQGLGIILTDITERKKAEEALKESEEKYRSLIDDVLDTSSVGIFILDSEFKVAWINKATEEYFGIKRENVIGKDKKQLINSEIKGIFEDPKYFTKKVFDTYKDNNYIENFECHITTGKDREERWLSHWSQPITEGLYKNGRIEQYTDITDRKRAEEKTITAEENLKNTFDLSPSIIAKANLDTGYFIEANQAVTRILGYSIEEFTSKQIIEFIHPADQQKTTDQGDRQLEGKEVIYFENRYLCKDGLYKWIAWYGTKADENGIVTVIGSDIAERKRVEISLHESKKRFDLAMVATNDGLWDWNVQTGDVYFNPSYSRILGELDLPQEFGSWGNRIHPDDKEVVHLSLEAHLKEETGFWQKEHRLRTKSREWIWVLGRGSVVEWDKNGQAMRMVGTMTDITERKQIEQDLLESEERFRLLMDAITAVVWITNDTGQFVEPQVEWEAYTGQPWEKHRGWGWTEAIHPDDRERVGAIWQEATGEVKPYEAYGRIWHAATNDYHYFGVTAVHRRNPDGSVREWIGTVVDIDDRMRAEKALKESEENLKNTFDLSPSIICKANLDTGYFIEANNAVTRILGYSVDEFLATSFIELIHPEDQQQATDEKDEQLKGKEVISFENRYLCKDGSYKWMAWHGTKADENGVVTAIGSDISERKIIEQEIIKAKEKAEESDRLKSAFLANMSHEIRTPMNGILGFADLLKEPGLTGDEQLKYVGIIEKSGERMLNIINDIIDISKIESGLIKVKIGESDINEQIEYLHTFFKPETAAKGLTLLFENELPSLHAIILTDREKVFAILTNLVKNAIKYTNKGSIEFGYQKTDGFLEFYVKDTGIGIPLDRQESIFERFIQADIEDKMARQGAGLGLAISKAYIEMLGGKIWVESTEGLGSTFYFTLPYTTKADKENSSKTNGVQYKAANLMDDETLQLKVLIAEDDENSELLLNITLEEYCKEILKAGTGIEAIEVCRNNPDLGLILMDIQMPALDGYEATRQIREFNKDVVIIAQTAYGLSGDREKALAAGCNDYISKPIVKSELLVLIQKYFSK